MKNLLFISLLTFFCFLNEKVFTQTFESFAVWKVNTSGVQNIRFSPNGKLLASAGTDGRLIVWDVAKGTQIQNILAHHGYIYDLCFSADSKLLASTGVDGLANLWEIRTGMLINSYQTKGYTIHQSYQISSSFVIFSPDQKYLYFGGDNCYLMKAIVGKNEFQAKAVYLPTDSLEKPLGAITAATCSADKKHLIFTVNHSIKWLNFKNDQIEKEIFYESDYFNDVNLVPSPNMVATWSYDGKVIFWNTQDKTQEAVFQASMDREYSGTSFDKSGKLMLTAGSGNSVKVWDWKNKKMIQQIDAHTKTVRIARFSPTQQVLATAGLDGVVQIWKERNEKIVPLAEIPEQELSANHTKTPVFINKKIKFDHSEITLGEWFLLKKVEFEQSTANILADSYLELDKIVDLMNVNKKMVIELAGHTDNLGDSQKNYTLSKNRVEVVKNYITAKGIDPNRILTQAFGGQKPIDQSGSKAGRKRNRRVEMKISNI